jgi:ankyrin repeat protein
MLIEKGANVNAKSQHPGSGDMDRTALDLAKFHGNTAVVDLLVKSGATARVPAVISQARASLAVRLSEAGIKQNDEFTVRMPGKNSDPRSDLEVGYFQAAAPHGGMLQPARRA